jgi:L-threonylcarbamoyladenylate synthase
MAAELCNIFDADDPDLAISRAAELLDNGKLVVLPTETVYGVAARIDLPDSLAALNAHRGKSDSPVTIHVPGETEAIELLGMLTPIARRMVHKLWPGPVAIEFAVSDADRARIAARCKVPESSLFKDGHMTLRCPDHVVTGEVLLRARGPVAIAKSSVQPPLDEKSVAALEASVGMVIDAGPTKYNRASTIVRAGVDSYEIVRAGIFDQRIIDRLLKTTVLFVCSGNTCRSPMAMAMARKILMQKLGVTDLAKAGYFVQSAGSFAMPGLRATPQAVQAVESLGGELQSHRSTPLSPELIHQADVIFAMTRSHAHAVLGMSPNSSDRLKMLDPAGDVEDPIGGDVSLYKELATKFVELIDQRLEETVLKNLPKDGGKSK